MDIKTQRKATLLLSVLKFPIGTNAWAHKAGVAMIKL